MKPWRMTPRLFQCPWSHFLCRPWLGVFGPVKCSTGAGPALRKMPPSPNGKASVPMRESPGQRLSASHSHSEDRYLTRGLFCGSVFGLDCSRDIKVERLRHVNAPNARGILGRNRRGALHPVYPGFSKPPVSSPRTIKLPGRQRRPI